MFIVFEGIDGAGKTTLSKMVFDWLADLGKQVYLTKEPRSFFQSKVNHTPDLNKEAEMLLYLAGRAHYYHNSIAPALQMGKIVLADRYTDSTVVYQGFNKGCDIKLIREINNYITKGVTPDLVIYLDVSPENAINRSSVNTLEGFTKLKSAYDFIYNETTNVERINADRPLEEVFTDVQERIFEYLEK